MLKATCLMVALGIAAIGSAKADKLDDIINSGKLRCAVALDFRQWAPVTPTTIQSASMSTPATTSQRRSA